MGSRDLLCATAADFEVKRSSIRSSIVKVYSTACAYTLCTRVHRCIIDESKENWLGTIKASA